MSLVLAICLTLVASVAAKGSCQFAHDFQCENFKQEKYVRDYLHRVMKWEGRFAQPGVGYDPVSGYTYDGHPIDYETGGLYGEPHLFSAPSKESIHLGLLALAIDGDEFALEFAGGQEEALALLQKKMAGYMKFNASFPGYGCFTPWVGFTEGGEAFAPLPSWSTPAYKVPGLDNGEWFWSLYAVTHVLNRKYALFYPALTQDFNAFLSCQKQSAKTIFYRGAGDVSATVYIKDVHAAPSLENYYHCDGYLNDPYEGETLTVLLYLFSPWDSAEEREMLWEKKRGLFERVEYSLPSLLPSPLSSLLSPFTSPSTPLTISAQKGWWFSTHEDWKLLLLPYLDAPLVRAVYLNGEKVRALDALAHHNAGLMASINDVTDGSETIPDYASACGVGEVAYEKVERRDLFTPYASFGMLLQDRARGLCWYNNMLQGSRMQSQFGSTEAINRNATEISPLLTWDSKVTSLLAVLGGVGRLVKEQMVSDQVYAPFLSKVEEEYTRVFTSVESLKGTDVPLLPPLDRLPADGLQDWDIAC